MRPRARHAAHARAFAQHRQALSGRKPREYATLTDAESRMREANPHLTAEMARHLTIHGVMRLENGNYVWKFDNYVRAFSPHSNFGYAAAGSLQRLETRSAVLIYKRK